MKRRTPQLGQHFLKSPWASDALAHALPTEGACIVEIGPGKGALTKALLKTGAIVYAIEKDPALVVHLTTAFQEALAAGRLVLIEKDIRDIALNELVPDGRPYVVGANIPYYITGVIIRLFLTAAHKPRAMALLIQKEVAQRIVSKKESLLSLSVKAYGTPSIIAKVSKTHFSPAPSVDSAIILIEHISADFFNTLSEDLFFKVLKAGFAAKRKMLGGNLAAVFEKERVTAALEAAAQPSTVRAEDVPLAAWRVIAQRLA